MPRVAPVAVVPGAFQIGRRRKRIGVRTFGRFGGQFLPFRTAELTARVIGRDIARDREEPGLKRAIGFVSVPGLVQRHKHFLVNVFKLVGIHDAPAQEPGYGRTHVVEQGTAGVAVAILHAPHQARPHLAALRPRGAIHLISFVRHG